MRWSWVYQSTAVTDEIEKTAGHDAVFYGKLLEHFIQKQCND